MQGLMLPHIGQVWLMSVTSITICMFQLLVAERLVDALPVRRGWISAYQAVLDGSLLEQHARWDAQDIVLHREILVVVYVDLNELDFALVFFR